MQTHGGYIRMELNEIRSQKAGVIIGKNGISPGVIKEIQDRMKQNRFVKIKILKSALSSEYAKKDLVDNLVNQTNFQVIEIRGNSVILQSDK